MTAEEIRKMSWSDLNLLPMYQCIFLAEIAAQLAEYNAHMKEIAKPYTESETK